MTYSPDFRKKVLTLKEQEGLTQAETAARFGVGVASVTRWGTRVEAKLTRTTPATKIGMEALGEDVRTCTDAYQYERAARLGVSQRAIGYALKRLGVSYKKNAVTSESGRKRTAILQDKMAGYQAGNQPIVYLDESGFANDMPRTHGYAPVGKRCVGKHGWHANGRTNVIGALLASSLLTATLFTGPVNADVFFAWLSQDLPPKLPTNAVIVMDNASFHKREDARQPIERGIRSNSHRLIRPI